MTKKNNVIVINWVMWADDVIRLSPINATITHNVVIRPVGDGAVQAILTPNRDGMGTGWSTLDEDIRSALLESL